MAAIDKFEDLIAWQKARALTRGVYEVTRKQSFARDYGLANQIQRAVVSTMSNIAEGFERGRRKEFHQALSTAKGSCAEVRSLLVVASDIGYIDQGEFAALMTQAREVSRIIGGLRSAVQRQISRDDVRKPRTTKSPTQSSALSPQS